MFVCISVVMVLLYRKASYRVMTPLGNGNSSFQRKINLEKYLFPTKILFLKPKFKVEGRLPPFPHLLKCPQNPLES